MRGKSPFQGMLRPKLANTDGLGSGGGGLAAGILDCEFSHILYGFRSAVPNSVRPSEVDVQAQSGDDNGAAITVVSGVIDILEIQ